MINYRDIYQYSDHLRILRFFAVKFKEIIFSFNLFNFTRQTFLLCADER